MTMQQSSTRAPEFPEHPEDGFLLIEYLDDGRQLHWVYSKTLNQWASHFVYPESPATVGWVQGQGYVKGPAKAFASNYDGDRVVRTGDASTDLDNGDVLFLDEQLVSTNDPDQVKFISLPVGEFDWNAFTNSGNIKVKAGSLTAGYYYAFAFMRQSSQQVLVSLFPLKTYPQHKLEAETGASCYFRGLFFM